MSSGVPEFNARWVIVCSLATLLITYIAWTELQRVEDGRLFLFALPGETNPSRFEKTDARESASNNKQLAAAALIAIGLLVTVAGPKSISNLSKLRTTTRTLLLLFAVAVVADLLSTILFFHQTGIDNELHPAIRLMGYRYGRTMGPIFGKVIQATGVLFVAAQLDTRGRWLIILVTVVYFAAAVYNLSHSL